MPFEKQFVVAWSHLDANGHMANTAYLDVVVDVRFMYFTQCGFPPSEFAKRRFGPVVRRDEVDYFKELRMHQVMTVDLQLSGISDDASRFKLRNSIRREDGELAATITTLGGWIDLAARKLIAPPEELAAALRALDRTADFTPLESSVRK
jgi:acyl-CoA thioester hydrolase